jgi:hypothetical protein
VIDFTLQCNNWGHLLRTIRVSNCTLVSVRDNNTALVSDRNDGNRSGKTGEGEGSWEGDGIFDAGEQVVEVDQRLVTVETVIVQHFSDPGLLVRVDDGNRSGDKEDEGAPTLLQLGGGSRVHELEKRAQDGCDPATDREGRVRGGGKEESESGSGEGPTKDLKNQPCQDSQPTNSEAREHAEEGRDHFEDLGVNYIVPLYLEMMLNPTHHMSLRNCARVDLGDLARAGSGGDDAVSGKKTCRRIQAISI